MVQYFPVSSVAPDSMTVVALRSNFDRKTSDALTLLRIGSAEYDAKKQALSVLASELSIAIAKADSSERKPGFWLCRYTVLYQPDTLTAVFDPRLNLVWP